MNAADVERIRGKAGKTQAAFASMLGLSPRTIRGWEGTRSGIVPKPMQLLLEAVEAAYDGQAGFMGLDWLERFGDGE